MNNISVAGIPGLPIRKRARRNSGRIRLKFSSQALHAIGEAQEWYELQNPGLGDTGSAA